MLDYLTVELPRRLFHCEYANVFTLSEDSPQHRLLVLEKTGCPAIQCFEQRRAYPCGSERYVIPWVARRTVAGCDQSCDRRQLP